MTAPWLRGKRGTRDAYRKFVSSSAGREPNPNCGVVKSMMTHAKKIIRPIALAAAMMFMTPVVGLVSASFHAPAPVQYSSSETVVYKTDMSVLFKS